MMQCDADQPVLSGIGVLTTEEESEEDADDDSEDTLVLLLLPPSDEDNSGPKDEVPHHLIGAGNTIVKRSCLCWVV